jgi:hypothetical protein
MTNTATWPAWCWPPSAANDRAQKPLCLHQIHPGHHQARKDVGVDGDAQRIGQLVWMLFLKIFDALRAGAGSSLDDDYRSPHARDLPLAQLGG